MVLDTTEIDYQYPSPSSPPTPSQVRSQVKRQSSLPTPAVSKSPEKQPYNQQEPNATTAMFPKSPLRMSVASTPTSSIRKSQIVIEIPSIPTSVRRDDYKVINGSPKRRKLTDDFRETKPSIHIRAQKDIADAALVQCESLLDDIFAAQDQLEPDTSLTSLPNENAHFDISSADGEGKPILRTEVHHKLQFLMKQLVDNKRFGDLSSEYLSRLYHICEDSVEAAQTMNLKLDGELSESDIEEWQAKIETALNGSSAAATIVWMMIGNPRDEESVTPDAVRWLPNVLVNVFENCLIPAIESRPDSRDAEIFKNATMLKDGLRSILSSARKLLDLVATVCVQVNGAEEAINATEFLAAKLIFVENAKNEKESVLGLQTFEKVRKTAMSVLAKLFAKFPQERAAILDEILSSMDKLPSTSRSARQFTVSGGKIQLISALIMQLVQTTASEAPDGSNRRELQLLEGRTLGGDLSDEENDDVPMKHASEPKGNVYQTDAQRLLNRVHASYDNGVRSAGQIVGYLIYKASTSTKTGDQPYRNLLDLFIQDLLEVMPLTEWPASELILRIIANQMIDIARHDQTALAKNMALEALGNLGSAISTLRASVPSMAAAVSREALTTISQHLLKLADDQSQGGVRNEDLVATDGPLRLVYQTLVESNSDGLQTRSACGFSLAQWAKTACMSLRLTGAEDVDTLDPETCALLEMLLGEMEEPGSQMDDLKKMSGTQGKLAHTLANLNQGLGRRFADIVKTLSGSFTSGQSQVRSRSLKSVVSILETDSSLLDRDATLMDDIFRCVSDDSAMVRDSALALIAKIIVWKPALQEKGVRHILESSGDAKIGVQKKALGHLKDIYLRNASLSLQAAIAENILRRTADLEVTVSELAKKTLTELWVNSKLSLVTKQNEHARDKVAINDLALILVRTIARSPLELTPLAEEFFKVALTGNKIQPEVTELYTTVVHSLFESIVTEAGPLSENNNKEALLLTLNIFANANARMITPDQLSALRPYLGNLVSEQDLQLFKPVVAIFRAVLPHLSATHKVLLQDIHQDLMKTMTKLQRRNELDEVLESIWTIHPIVESTDKLINLTISVLKGISNTRAPSASDLLVATPEQEKQYSVLLGRKRNYIRIAGSIGKHFDLEHRSAYFASQLPNWSGDTLAGYIVNIVAPFTGNKHPSSLRTTALESLGAICFSWPSEFKQEIVQRAFMGIFKLDDTADPNTMSLDLQGTALKAFLDMLVLREAAKKASDEAAEGKEQQDLKRLGGSVKAGDQDGAVAVIAQDYLPSILKAALGRQDEKALLAINVITSIDRQGLVHPKQCMGTIVALEGSPTQAVAEIAGEHQRQMHSQHESMYEREYIKAVQDAFDFQKETVGDSAGTTRAPFRSKMWRCYEIINGGSTKFVKKFLSQLISRANVEIPRLDTDQVLPEHMLLTRFITHNLAFFEYAKLDELLHTIHHIEVVFGKTGAEIAQAVDAALHINSGAPMVDLNSESLDVNGQVNGGENHAPASTVPEVEPALLKRLATAATMMTMLWETRSYLKRQYGITQDVRQSMAQLKQSKESGKPPSRIQGITGDRYFNSTATLVRSLDSLEAMLTRCQEFSALMTIDDEVKVAAEDDDEARARFSASVDVDEEQAAKTGRGRKRKLSASVAGTPKKKRGRPSLKTQKSRRGSTGSRSSRDDHEGEFEGY
jgi:cohesin loading factor subunit SCC2